MAEQRWRVAVTRDDNADGSVQKTLAEAGFAAVSCPVLLEGPAPDLQKLSQIARELQTFDWVICASARAVRAISDARGSSWPAEPRTAAVGSVTAAAMRDAGAREPVVGSTFTARALWETLQPLDAWAQRRVLVTTVSGGRRELIDGLRAEGAIVTELEPYTMTPRPAADIRRDWQNAEPDAAIIASAQTAHRLIEAVGVDALRNLKAIVPIGPTTSEALAKAGILAEPPDRATFADAIEKLKSLLPA